MKVPAGYYASNASGEYLEAFKKIAAEESARTGVFVSVKATDRNHTSLAELQFQVGDYLCGSLMELRKILKNKAFM